MYKVDINHVTAFNVLTYSERYTTMDRVRIFGDMRRWLAEYEYEYEYIYEGDRLHPSFISFANENDAVAFTLKFPI